jgi:hypothetical protein
MVVAVVQCHGYKDLQPSYTWVTVYMGSSMRKLAYKYIMIYNIIISHA